MVIHIGIVTKHLRYLSLIEATEFKFYQKRYRGIDRRAYVTIERHATKKDRMYKNNLGKCT